MNFIQKAKNLGSALVVTGGFFAAQASHAGAIDVADVVTDIAAQATPVGLIGAAVLILFVAIKAFRWVRQALQ